MHHYVAKARKCQTSESCDGLLLSFIANQESIINQNKLTWKAFLTPLSVLTSEPLEFYFIAKLLFLNEEILFNLINRGKISKAETIYEHIRLHTRNQRSKLIDNRMMQIYANNGKQNQTLQLLKEIGILYPIKHNPIRFEKEQIQNLMSSIDINTDIDAQLRTLQSALNYLANIRNIKLFSDFDRFQLVGLFEADLSAHIQLHEMTNDADKTEEHILNSIKQWLRKYSFLIPVTEHIDHAHIRLNYIVNEAVIKWICRYLLYLPWIGGKIIAKQFKISFESIRLAKILELAIREWTSPNGSSTIDPVRDARHIYVFLPEICDYKKLQ